MKEILISVCIATLIWRGSFAHRQLFNQLNALQVPTPSENISTIDAADRCVPSQNCDANAPYRTFDGSCNNLRFSMWGQAQTALTRLAQAEYQDGVSEPRRARSGNSLPSARQIVVKAFSFDEVPDNRNTLAIMTFGQMVSHDGSLIGSPPSQPESCCTDGGPRCMNIKVSINDPFYNKFNVTCLPLIRAASTDSIGCSLRPVYTLTEVSHFMDASFVYGSSDQQAAGLRTHSGGLLSESLISNQSFPPHSAIADLCFGQSPGDLCMDTGDVRANQNPPLAVLQVVFFREHNRLATQLHQLNPSWDDEKLYQEARRILIAEYQIIIYKDWLPNIIGQETAVSQNLIPNLDTMSDDYDEFLNPSTTNDFTSAAYRVFHSQIPSAYCAQGAQDRAVGCPFGANRFSNSFDNPNILSTLGGFRSVLFGLDRQNMDKTDKAFTKEISGRLFRRDRPWGQDLVATDIARGRDVGLPSYNKYRSLCGMVPATTWAQLIDVFPVPVLRKLRSLYESPDDIDLYVAGVLERKFRGSMVGPIFQCLIVDQFRRWMKGDRYFVDFRGFNHSFTQDQASALKSTSFARIICDNVGNLTDIPRNIFLLGSERVPCNELPQVDLSPWRAS